MARESDLKHLAKSINAKLTIDVDTIYVRLSLKPFTAQFGGNGRYLEAYRYMMES